MNDWTWTQAGRAGQIATVLGQDKVLLERFSATERFSEPFFITADVVSQDSDIDFTPHLASGVSITVGGDPAQKRFFHGVLYEAARRNIEGSAARYQLVLRPWLSLLDLGRNSRIFQTLSVKDIVEKVIKAAGFTDYSITLSSRGLAPRDYCVQYRESDFAFISRLMEEEGIYYYFVHSETSHKMIIHDDSATEPESTLTVPVWHGSSQDKADPRLWNWGPKLRPAVNKVSLRDVNFHRPTEILKAEKLDSADATPDRFEFYDHPGGFGQYADDGTADGAPYAESLLLASRSPRKLFAGEGDVFAIPVGSRLSVTEGFTTEKVLVVAATHSFSGQSYIAADEDALQMNVAFEASPSSLSWRPLRKTPKPVAGGPQVAVVVGAAGEVIEVDAFGRIHVQFPWDREGKQDSKSSCWVRVSQSSAGQGFGHMHIPRIGEEVIVDFLDGDLDRPIVTGRIYNASQTTPYKLADEKTKSTWKSQTIGDSGSYDETEEPPSGKGFNEIRFEDKGGSEEVFLHAQRDLTAWYRHDETRKTGRDTTVRVGRNRETAVKKNETLTVETGDETRKIAQGARTTTIQKDDSLTLQQGDYSLKVSAGQATFEAMQKITLKVGSNQIVISPQGIEVSGLTVKVTATTSLALKGLVSEFKADTMLTINGVMVQIN